MRINAKAIIFDMDGTIIDSEGFWEKNIFRTLKRRGISEFTTEQMQWFDSLRGICTIDLWRGIKEIFQMSEPLEELMEDDFGNALQYFGTEVIFLDGFAGFHSKLTSQNMPTAIATNAPLDHLTRIGERLEFAKYFGQHLYSSCHVQKPKPDPGVFLHAAKMLKVDPCDCVVFEDSIRGFEAAKAAGMKCIAIKHAENESGLHLVDASIDHYNEAPAALSRV